ncbi:hypothetical protein LI328DRAFT_122941 [Trichoderma asperelloides]|nr:hypothetical protein LI328DRAFT_122941 [Trichoderma asperelloides]
MGLSVRIAADFVFTIFWGWLEKLSHWNPSSISWGISSEDYDPGGRTCCTRCSCWGNMCCYRKTPWRYLHDQLEQQDLSCFQLTFSQPPVLIKPKQQIIRPSVSQRFSLSLHSQSSYGQPPTIWQRLLDASMRAHRLLYGESPLHILGSKKDSPSPDDFSFVRPGAIPSPNPQIEFWQ